MPESSRFDAESFYAAIAATVVARSITWKQASAETGISQTTLTRMSQGRRPDAESLARLAAWAGLNIVDFVDNKSKRPPEPLAQIGTLLRSDPRLPKQAAKTLETMLQTAYHQLKSDLPTSKRK